MLSAVLLAAEIDDVSRFECPGQLISWTGMCPTLHLSENVEYHGRTSKATNRLVNWIMIQCALTASVYDPKMSTGRTVRHITFPHGLGMWPRLTALVLPSICRAVGAPFLVSGGTRTRSPGVPVPARIGGGHGIGQYGASRFGESTLHGSAQHLADGTECGSCRGALACYSRGRQGLARVAFNHACLESSLG